MDFDFKHIGVPFRMLPGLARLPPDARHLTPLDVGSARYQERLAVSRSGGAMHCVAGFDPADALRAIAACAADGTALGPGGHPAALELAFEEDLALLDAASGSVPWMCVCTPSGWAPEEKLGLDLQSIHTPVADIGHLSTAWPHLMALATNGERWERFVWTISRNPHLNQHPKQRHLARWPADADADALAALASFRTERQTFIPLPEQRLAIFTIHVETRPLADAAALPADARQLHDALASMSQSVLAYRGLEGARDRLLTWLRSRASATARSAST